MIENVEDEISKMLSDDSGLEKIAKDVTFSVEVKQKKRKLQLTDESDYDLSSLLNLRDPIESSLLLVEPVLENVGNATII